MRPEGSTPQPPAAPAAPSPATRRDFGPVPDEATRTEILRLREATWWAWFTNDRAAFDRLVPHELLAIGWSGGPWNDRASTLEHMDEFARTGAKLRSLEFPVNEFQSYGDVVIVYTAFHATLAPANGGEQIVHGRGTEVFVRRGGQWVHTAWHLDNVAPANGA
ncbi:MAG: nuclear transport factor 2 family protein [Candidatus Eisenbacteria bacterium]